MEGVGGVILLPLGGQLRDERIIGGGVHVQVGAVETLDALHHTRHVHREQLARVPSPRSQRRMDRLAAQHAHTQLPQTLAQLLHQRQVETQTRRDLLPPLRELLRKWSGRAEGARLQQFDETSCSGDAYQFAQHGRPLLSRNRAHQQALMHVIKTARREGQTMQDVGLLLKCMRCMQKEMRNSKHNAERGKKMQLSSSMEGREKMMRPF